MLKGYRWRVRDGKSINVWTDYWLPQHKLIPKPATTLLGHQNDIVESLIDTETRWWNVDKIQSLIPAQQAAEILKILLSSKPAADCIIWNMKRMVSIVLSQDTSCSIHKRKIVRWGND